jgi:glycogen operon protein
MVPEDWDIALGRSVGVFLNGNGIRGQDAYGRPINDAHFLMYFNADDTDVDFRLPGDEYAPGWDVLLDTSGETAGETEIPAGAQLRVPAKSTAVLRAHEPVVEEVDHSVAASLAAQAGSSSPNQPSTSLSGI